MKLLDDLLLYVLYHLAESRGYGRLEVHEFACHGMYERQAVVVQHQSPDWVRVAAILSVTSYWMTYISELYTYLILATCKDLNI